MSIIEKAGKAIASKTAAILNLDQDHREVLEYGALNFLQTLFTVILIVLFGILAGSLPEILVLSLTAALLRQFSGGVHATSPYRCAVLSVLIFGGLSLLVKYDMVFSSRMPALLFQGGALVFILVFLYRYAPADSPNKRIKNPDTIHRLRKSSFFFVMAAELLTAVLWEVHLQADSGVALQFLVCIQLGMLWQALSITPVMHRVICWMDSLLIKFNPWKGGVRA